MLAANLFAEMPVMSRPDEQVTVDALRLIQGLGANFVRRPRSSVSGSPRCRIPRRRRKACSISTRWTAAFFADDHGRTAL